MEFLCRRDAVALRLRRLFLLQRLHTKMQLRKAITVYNEAILRVIVLHSKQKARLCIFEYDTPLL